MGYLVPVRDAVPDDARALTSVWHVLLSGSRTYARSSPPPTAYAVRLRIEEILTDPLRKFVVAEPEGSVAGAAYFAREPLTPMNTSEAVRVSYLWVFAPYRRQGVGHALIEAAVAWAGELAADHLVVDVEPGDRDTNRFLARLGLSPLITQRSAPLPALRRRLASDRASAEDLSAPLSRVRHPRLVIRNPWPRTISAGK